MQVMNTKDLAVAAGVRMLVYGVSGVGKTMLCATAPKPVVISAEQGLLSLSERNIRKVHGDRAYPSLPVVQVRDHNHLKFEVLPWLFHSEEAKQYQTICVDSLTELAHMTRFDAMTKYKDGRKSYGETLDWMRQLLLWMGQTQYNWYCTAHINETDQSVQMPGQAVGRSIPWFFDEVFCLIASPTEENPNERWLLTAPDGERVCKDRSGALERWERPHLHSIIAKIRKGA